MEQQFPHPAFILASPQPDTVSAALQLLKAGRPPMDLTPEALLEERGRIARQQQQLPRISELPDLLDSEQLTNEDLVALLAQYPRQRVL